MKANSFETRSVQLARDSGFEFPDFQFSDFQFSDFLAPRSVPEAAFMKAGLLNHVVEVKALLAAQTWPHLILVWVS